MASLSRFRALSVEQLLEAVEQLSPAERREFQLRLLGREEKNGHSTSGEETLRRRPLPAAERRLRTLITRSEQGKLTPKELAEYQSLAEEAKQIDAAKAESLADLARRSSADPKAGRPARRPRG